MARISNKQVYPQDQNLESGDYLLGTDISGSITATKTYTLDSLKEFLNTGVDVREESGSWHIPIVTIDGQAVEQSHIRQYVLRTTTENTTFTSSNADDNIHMDARLNNDGNDGVTLVIYNYKQAYSLNSFIGRPVTITTSEDTFTGTITSMVEHDPVDSTTGLNKITEETSTPGVYRTVHRFVISEITAPVSPTAIAQTVVVSPGLQYLMVAIESDVETRNLDVDGDLQLGDTSKTGASGNLTTTGNTSLGGTLGVTGAVDFDSNLNVDGTSQFNSNVTIGNDGDDGMGEAELHIHGDMHFDDDQGGIIFGHPDPSVTLTTDGNNLSFGGSGNIQMGNDVNFTESHNLTLAQGDVTVSNGDLSVHGTTTLEQVDADDEIVLINADEIKRRISTSSDTELTPIRPVSVNTPISPARFDPADIVDGGVISDIYIGNSVFHAPRATSSVAQILPGLTEELVGPDSNITTGTFFHGTDRGTFVEYTRAAANSSLTTPLAITAGTTRLEVTDATDNTELIADFRENRANERLFFLDSATTLATRASGASANDAAPTAGNIVQGVVYEVVSYVAIAGSNPGVLEFTRVGGGAISVSSNTFNIDSPTVNVSSANFNFTNLSEDDTATNLLFTDSSGRVSSSQLNTIAGAQATQRATDGDNTGPLQSIDYEGNHNVSFAGGTLSVNLTGRYNPATINSFRTADFTAVEFGAYILGALSANPAGQDYAATVTLPNGHDGDSIKFVNLSTVGNMGNAIASGTWRIIPAAGENIMRLPVNEELILNDPSANFELIYSTAAISGETGAGWILIGTN